MTNLTQKLIEYTNIDDSVFIDDGNYHTIEDGAINALVLLNRKGVKPDLCIMSSDYYAALVKSLGAKVQYVKVNHDEVEVASEGFTLQSTYGRVTVLADRSCPPQTAYFLTMKTWKLQALGKINITTCYLCSDSALVSRFYLLESDV